MFQFYEGPLAFLIEISELRCIFHGWVSVLETTTAIKGWKCGVTVTILYFFNVI